MIAMLIALALSAEPKDCKEDKACFEAEAKTCKPVKLVRHAEKEISDNRGKSTATTVVEGVVNGKCVVDYQAQLDEFQVGERFASMFHMTDAGTRSTYETQMLAMSKLSPLAHLRCEVKPGDAVAWLNRGLHSGTPPPYPSEVLKDCVSTLCDPLPKLAADCLVMMCMSDMIVMVCKPSVDNHCKVKRGVDRPKGCVLRCNGNDEAVCTK